MANLGNLLAWGIENSNAETGERKTELNPGLLAQLFGNQKDDATLMKEAMEAILHSDTSLENKMTAFDNFEMMIEQLDNANNIENLKLWPPLLSLLEHEEHELRLMAAWCCGTAVQNNPKSQDGLVKHDGIAKLVDRVLRDPAADVRKKAIYALSSGIRNHDGAMRVAMALLPDELKQKDLDSQDMEGIDRLMTTLRERSAKVISRGEY